MMEHVRLRILFIFESCYQKYFGSVLNRHYGNHDTDYLNFFHSIFAILFSG